MIHTSDQELNSGYLFKDEILTIFNNYNYINNNIQLNDEKMNFIEVCKIVNVKSSIIKDCFLLKKMNINLVDNNDKSSFDYILHNFINSTNISIINNIQSIKCFIQYLDKYSINRLINDINIISIKYNDNKNTYTSLKNLLIECNKYAYNKCNLNNKIKSLYEILKNTENINRILFYLKKISFCIDKNNKNDKDNLCEIIKYSESIIENKHIVKSINIYYILKLINRFKVIMNNQTSNLEIILKNININIYNYVYFLNNKNLITCKNSSLEFVINLNYNKKHFKEIDTLNLKRGFIQGINKDGVDYLLKYQPNKSVMEIIINCYLKSICSKYFLIPNLFFINSDNSYFYIIEKYNSDLYKFFNILGDNKKILKFNDILKITKFIIDAVVILHNNNIIHADLKLENIIINYDKNYTMTNLKIIDFDVALFNEIPKCIVPYYIPYEKIFNNKKPRGTRIYMLKHKTMSYKNDIYSIGVIALILLYKNIKIIISQKKDLLKVDTIKNKKNILKYHTLLKKLNLLRDNIEDDKNKIKMLNLIYYFLSKNSGDIGDFFQNNIEKIRVYKNFILDCLHLHFNIHELYKNYDDVLFSHKV